MSIPTMRLKPVNLKKSTSPIPLCILIFISDLLNRTPVESLTRKSRGNLVCGFFCFLSDRFHCFQTHLGLLSSSSQEKLCKFAVGPFYFN